MYHLNTWCMLLKRSSGWKPEWSGLAVCSAVFCPAPAPYQSHARICGSCQCSRRFHPATQGYCTQLSSLIIPLNCVRSSSKPIVEFFVMRSARFSARTATFGGLHSLSSVAFLQMVNGILGDVESLRNFFRVMRRFVLLYQQFPHFIEQYFIISQGYYTPFFDVKK